MRYYASITGISEWMAFMHAFDILNEYHDLFSPTGLANSFPGASDTSDNHIIYKSILIGYFQLEHTNLLQWNDSNISSWSLLAQKKAKRLHSVHSILAVITGSDYSSSDSWSKAFWALESEAVHFLRPISMSPICLPSHHFEDLERLWA